MLAILSTQVLMDFYHKGFVTADSNKRVHDMAPERIVPLGGVDPRDPKALYEVERQITECGVKGFKWYTRRMARHLARLEGQRSDGVPAV